MRSGNPALASRAFSGEVATRRTGVMTIQGCINKTAILLVLAVATASVTWSRASVSTAAAMPWMYAGMIAGLVLALVTIFKKAWSPATAPMYALAEGLFLGALSCVLNQRFPGIAIQAVGLTFGVLFVMLGVYKARLIRVTEKFRAGVVAATGAIFLVYLLSWILNFFGASIPYIHGTGLIGIGFSVAVVIIASLNLVLDFDFIERASGRGLPKYMEWYAAFGLMVTLVWLYLEILRLLAKVRGRR